ncbi:MAG TPA: DUF433 domain-containing protein [Candidatus Xenobia bacterium]
MIKHIPRGLEHVMNIDPEILGGEPCFNKTRIPLETVVDNLGAGYCTEEIRDNFPSLTEDHIQAVRQWELN